MEGRDQLSPTYIVWEINAKGKRGRKSGTLSLGEARVLQQALPTITGHRRCTYVIEPAEAGQIQGGEQYGSVD